jgi:hypothetical protein
MALPRDGVLYHLFFEESSQNETANEIMDFTRLPKGWHYGRGGPISKKVCAWALELNRHALAMRYHTTEAFPGVDGEVMVSAYIQNYTLDFTIYPDGHITFRCEIDDEDVDYADNLTLEVAKLKLTVLGYFIWNLFGSFIQDTSVKKKATSNTSSSSPVQVAEEYPLSTEDVLWQKVAHPVTTS